MPNVGYATLQVIPSVRGISDELRRQLIGPSADAGQRAGEESGGGFREAFTGALAAIGVTEIASKIGEQFTEAFNQAVEQSNVSGMLKAQLGATSKDAARYGKVAGQLYAKGVTDDLETAAESVKATLQGGLVPPEATKKQLREIATEMADVSKAFGSDLSLQSQAVAAQLKNGLAPDAKSALDVITVGFQKLGPNAEDLLETFQEYPIQLKKLGLDSRTALGLFSQGIKGGARDTDIIADALKEFSIRSIDMSASSRAAYKGLGLDAKSMEQQIAKGGSSATAGLQTVLDKLRSIHDPVKRESLAVGLFGTQAEELGTSLFKLDPSKATKTMGDVSGAAAQLGKDIRSGPGYEVTVFTRSVRQAFVNILGGQVLPVLGRAGTVLNRTVLPPLTTVATVVGGIVIGALKDLWSAGTAVVGWLQDMGTWLIPIGIAVAGFTAAVLAQQIAVAATTAVFSIYRGAILAWTLVQRGATIAQAAFNAVMEANVIVLVITAIVALAAALYVAYQRSSTFRAIVQAAWQGIQTAALYAWNNVLKPAFAGLMTGLSAIGTAFSWLWSAVIKPVFGFISTAARIWLTIMTIVVFGPIYLAVKALGAIFSWLWTNAISPVIGFLVTAFQLWWTSTKIIFGYFVGGLKVLGGWAMWLWRNAVSPVIAFLVAGFRLWWAGTKIVFGYFVGGLKTVGGWAMWLWKNAISPALAGARSVISTVYNSGIKPVLSALRTAIGKTGDAFGAAKDAIKIAWDKVKGIAKAPVEFVVNTVYGKLRGVWNTVAGAFGAPKLPAYHFATGGVLPGYTPGRDVHLAALSGGEAVMRPEWTRAVGPGYVNMMNAAARSGGVTGVQRALGLPAFADGGIFGWVKGAASKGVDLAKSGVKWLKDGVKASALAGLNSVVKPLINKISGSASLYRSMITGVPKKMLSTILDFSDKADKKLEAAGIGGKGYKAGLAWARTQAGKPYQWGGNGDPSWDCSGLVSAVESVIRGQKPHRRWATGAFSGATAPPGWVLHAASPYKIGVTNKGVGHTAGTLNGVNVESRGGDGVVIGAGARGYRNSLFTDWYGFKGYARGTRGAAPGWAWVGELGPELVNFGGGEQVLSNRDSMRASFGLGAVPGYAKGTSSASARKQVPGDLSSVSKVLTASAADIKKAFDELTKDLKAAGGSAKSLASSTSAAGAKLQALAKQRDAVAGKLEAARQTAADQKKTAADFLGLGNLTDSTSVAQIITGLQDRQATVKANESTIANLAKRGLNQDLIGQLVALGPDSALAGVVAGANKAQIAQLNQLAKSGAKLSTSYGRTMADSMFDAGKNASKGFLTGLQSQEKELQAAMNKLGDGLVASIKKKLKIKSPSRVTRWVGEMTGAGVGVGLDNTAATVAAAAARVADAAVPEVPAVSPASYTAAAAAQGGTLASGNRLWLVLEDGRQLAAYVDDRADGRVAAGMRQVRRKVRATSK
ncbi:phage tail tape measure protein [Streptomyces sp. NPDC057257]|uniref:phage tail tape measure protein n=1 Tax=Streptomyces sp. NPDC057257 TaxID=3346071 RepID=UPI003626A009